MSNKLHERCRNLLNFIVNQICIPIRSFWFFWYIIMSRQKKILFISFLRYWSNKKYGIWRFLYSFSHLYELSTIIITLKWVRINQMTKNQSVILLKKQLIVFMNVYVLQLIGLDQQQHQLHIYFLFLVHLYVWLIEIELNSLIFLFSRVI